MTDKSKKPLPSSSNIHIVGISIDEYDKLSPEALAAADGKNYDELPEEEREEYYQLSREKCQPYEEPISEEEWMELREGADRIRERQKELFVSVMDIPEVDWLVEGIAARQGITILFGDAGVGKTSLMLQLVASLDQGRELLGLRTERADTLLIEQDEGGSLLRSHIERMSPDCPSLKWLRVPRTRIRWDNDAADFEGGGGMLDELIFLSLASVVIIDSLTSLGIEDINHPRSAILFDRVRDLAEKYHCAFVILHHPNRSGDVMGSNLIRAKVDCLLHLQRGKLIFEKLRGTTPANATVQAGQAPYLGVRQRNDTLVFNIVNSIEQVAAKKLSEGKDKTTIVREIAEEWQRGLIDSNATNAESVKRMARTAVDRLQGNR